MLKAALIDHNDSFTWNIKAWLAPSFEVSVLDYRKINSIHFSDYDLIVLSPGPKTPTDYPLTQQLLASLPNQKAVLGICLGMQAMTLAEGGSVTAYYPPLHGKTSVLDTIGTPIARYHSLKCNMPDTFNVLSTSDQLPMIVQHKTKNWLGFQFHPESFLTEQPRFFLQMVVEQCSQ